MLIIGTLAGLALPFYKGYLEKVRLTRASADIYNLSSAIDPLWLVSEELPDTLAEVGFQDFLDPWGYPYQYLQIACDIKDKEKFKTSSGETTDTTKDKTKDGTKDKTKDEGTTEDPKKQKCESGTDPPGTRRDKLLKPLNTDYDLFSLGKDGASSEKIDAKESLDDIIRANEGAYVGLASEY